MFIAAWLTVTKIWKQPNCPSTNEWINKMQYRSIQWNIQFNSVTQSCLTLCDPMNCSMPGLPVHHQLYSTICVPMNYSSPRLLCPWNSPGKNTGAVSHSFLQGIFPTQGLNLGLLHCRLILYHLNCQGSPINGIQFSPVAQLCPTLCDPMGCSTPGLPVHHQLPECAQTHVHRVGDAIQPSHPLSAPYPLAFSLSQHQGLFQ